MSFVGSGSSICSNPPIDYYFGNAPANAVNVDYIYNMGTVSGIIDINHHALHKKNFIYLTF
jgi:hypothetical protein